MCPPAVGRWHGFGASIALILLWSTSVRSAEPVVTFQLEDGWVVLTLHQEQRPIADAGIKVFDRNDRVFAEGTTDEQGMGTFPLPKGDSFLVDVRIGAKTADSIRLSVIDQQIEPSRVLLTFGLQPCCQAPSRTAAATANLHEESSPVQPGRLPTWLQALGGVVFLVIGTLLLVVGQRSTSAPVSPRLRKRT